MKRTLLAVLLAAVFLAGCGGGQLLISDSGDSDVSVTDRDVVAGTATAQAVTAFPTLAPTAPYLDDPTDSLTVVLGGAYSNGGYWTWDDIANLLGVYDQYDAYVTSTADGVNYTGVPLPYLLRYARLNDYAQGTVFFTRDQQRFSYNTADLRDCMTCLIVRAPDETLTVVLPPVQPSVITHLVRIESR
jgi:hypothetical protein